MVNCYPVADKAKSLDICRAFAQGAGGIIHHRAKELAPGPSFFYGVDASNIHIWRQARDNHQDPFYYCDNAYFDSTRQEYFRITRDRLQHSGLGSTDGERFAALGIELKPWRRIGEHVVLCPQSDSFMRDIARYEGNWTQDAMSRLSQISKRPIRLRLWSPDKGKLASTLADDLKNAHALVTWSSAAAITAILSGIPAIVMGECAAEPMAAIRLEDVECPPRPDRLHWAGVLADNQWTLDEMRRGVAWEAVK